MTDFVRTPFSQIYDIMRADDLKFDNQQDEPTDNGLEEMMEREIGPPVFRDREQFVTDSASVPPLVYPRTSAN